MTFTPKAKQGNDASLAEIGSVLFLKTLKGRTNVVPIPLDPDDSVTPLTLAEVENLRREGRKAVFEGKSLRSCPYNMASRQERDAWLEGFNAGK